jgi:hypothetical protein
MEIVVHWIMADLRACFRFDIMQLWFLVSALTVPPEVSLPIGGQSYPGSHGEEATRPSQRQRPYDVALQTQTTRFPEPLRGCYAPKTRCPGR